MRVERRISSVASLIGAKLNGPDGLAPSRYYADSRLVGKGDAFVAFRGEKADGHDFIDDAVSRGASLIICEDGAKVPPGVSSIVVPDSFSAVPEMARRYLASFGDLEIIAVTGSVGKTTTREMIRAALSPSFRVHSAEHSYNTLIGCSLSILAMPPGIDVLILEMGTNHPGEIKEMVESFPPTVSVITEVTAAHLEGLGSEEGVLEAKFEIVQSPDLKALLFFGDNTLISRRCASLPEEVLRLGVGFGDCAFALRNVHFVLKEGIPCLSFDLVHNGKTYLVESSLFGRHSAPAAAFGMASAIFLGGSTEGAAAGIRSVDPLNGRGRFYRLESGAVLLDDSYNANPASMRASLSEALLLKERRKIAALGEMRELGDNALAHHEELLPLLGGFTKVFLTGKLWRLACSRSALPANAEFFDDPVSLGNSLKPGLREGDLLVVKGSRGNLLDRLVDAVLEGGAV
ncbi:MAG: UDP-N-acetylmuramoyl-tripeptide--D-alanyl-D-alanine ligase [Synergistaceae bacterium]|nr:UDP-N-acetylmuramoyl-tripeptide--D-alanyl-D-alanine ligase [Synergistota bacterium]NLM70636.1 UDP-N-acetylmuramoyl-tripeptide--D-alanyl-D-alanine ligase [Synergistaceae bacterium]